jgi:hypothetical protein
MPLSKTATTVPELLRNEFARLQLEIARRADALSKKVAPSRNTDLAVWLQAEREVFVRHQPARRKVTAG